MRVPPEVLTDHGSCSATHLVLKFWRSTLCVGVYKLPLEKVRLAAAPQVTVRLSWPFEVTQA